MTFNHEPPCENETDRSDYVNHAILENKVLKLKEWIYFFLRESGLATQRGVNSKWCKAVEQMEWKQKFTCEEQTILNSHMWLSQIINISELGMEGLNLLYND